MKLTLQPVRLADGRGGEGTLVFIDDELAAVLVRLPEQSSLGPRSWCLEAGFGRFGWHGSPVFPDLPSAEAWIRQMLQRRA
ncbi:MAG TPA: hypothetical protein VIL09_05090 [Microvirga sp.]|jgi:hypothetical protein